MYRQRNLQDVKRLRRLDIQYCVDLCENVRTVSGYGTELAPVLSQDLCSALPCYAMLCSALLSSLPLDCDVPSLVGFLPRYIYFNLVKVGRRG